jgi:Raf kinase inhibitor-like YbhB/YbcL family protein
MFALQCDSYNDKESIPTRHAHRSVAGGDNTSPGFSWTEPPAQTKSFAFSIIDPHPVARNWVHWLVINIPFRERRLGEGASRSETLSPAAKELKNGFSELGYGGPAPPKGSGRHPYVATIYALNVESLSLGVDTPLSKFQRELEGKIIAEATLTGYYER